MKMELHPITDQETEPTQETKAEPTQETKAEPTQETKAEPTKEVEPTQETEPTIDPEVAKAKQHGHVDKDEWVKQGNNPEDWVSARKFNERGDMIGRIKSLENMVKETKSDYEGRFDRVNQYHEIQLKKTIEDLESKKNTAIAQAESQEAADYQKQISDLENQKPQVDTTPKIDPAVEKWNQDNPWVFEADTPKSIYARNIFPDLLSKGYTTSQALTYLDTQLAKHFVSPNQAPTTNVNQAPTNNGSGKPGTRANTSRNLLWSDLNNEEKSTFDDFKDVWSKDDYLKVVKDARKKDKENKG